MDVNSPSDYLDIKFVGEEKEFLYEKAVNRGYIQIYRLINRCFFLREGEILTYQELLSYSGVTEGERRQIRPGYSRMSLSLGVAERTVQKNIMNLERLGFLVRERRGNQQTNLYYLQEYHKVPILVLSEHLHGVLVSLIGNDHTRISQASLARQSLLTNALFEIVRSSDSVWDHLKDIVAVFMQVFEGEPPAPEVKQAQYIPAVVASAAANVPRRDIFLVETESGGKPKGGIPPVRATRPQGKNNEKEIKDWGIDELVTHFTFKFTSKTTKRYRESTTDYKKIKELIASNPDYFTSEQVKLYIETYITQYSDFTPNMSTSHFTSKDTIKRIRQFLDHQMPITFEKKTVTVKEILPNPDRQQYSGETNLKLLEDWNG